MSFGLLSATLNSCTVFTNCACIYNKNNISNNHLSRKKKKCNYSINKWWKLIINRCQIWAKSRSDLFRSDSLHFGSPKSGHLDHTWVTHRGGARPVRQSLGTGRVSVSRGWQVCKVNIPLENTKSVVMVQI